jgi:hypothetical protein
MEVIRVEKSFPSSKDLHVQRTEVQRNWAGDMGNKEDNHKEKVGMDKEGEEIVLAKWQELEWSE